MWWTVYRRVADSLSTCGGQFIDLWWTVYRPVVDSLSTCGGQLIDLWWTVYRRVADSLSTCGGQLIDLWWTVHRPVVDSLSTCGGQFIDVWRTAYRPVVDSSSTCGGQFIDLWWTVYRRVTDSFWICGKDKHRDAPDGNRDGRLCHVIPSCLSFIGGNMRLVRKRKTLCAVLLGIAIILSFMLSHTIVFDISNAVREEVLHSRVLPPRPSTDHQGVSKGARQGPEEEEKRPCKPVRNVAFVKTHKAGSTTVANILLRYGLTHDLNFALPNTKLHSYGYNYISRAGEVLTRDYIYPIPPGQEYNILFNHAIYNRTAFRMIMPNDTVYLTILREPFQQFVSTFEYYHVEKYFAKKGIRLPNSTNPISTFLESPFAYDKSTAFFSYIRNKQAEDLGLSKAHYLRPALLKEYIDDMDRDFTLVMILEYFDESLLLLKRELCWSTKDILYFPHNANNLKPQRNFTESDHAAHRKISHVDYELYSHFFKVFWEKLQAQGDDFFQELAHFKSLLRQVHMNCNLLANFTVEATQWHDAFTVTRRNCQLLAMPELVSLDLLYKKANRKFPRGPNVHSIVRYVKKHNTGESQTFRHRELSTEST
ncbi:Galactosylceramide sulfotransferase [Bulinus truncatus]|nr:Galactosylceramide sulfotransferase [Bulinus truncatus]